jgi:serine/threonine protein kinase
LRELNSVKDNGMGPDRADSIHTTRFISDIELHQAPPESPVSAAKLFADYELLEVLGEGGMGIVHKARHLTLKRLVALKMVAQEHCSPSARVRFQREAETVARLQHRNIVHIYEVGENEGRPYLALSLSKAARWRKSCPSPAPCPRAMRRCWSPCSRGRCIMRTSAT